MLLGWLLAMSLAVLFGTAMSWALRVGLIVPMLVFGVAGIRRCCLLRTAGAVRAIGWSDEGRWQAWLVGEAAGRDVRIGRGSFRLGDCLFLLWLRSCDGVHAVLIDVKIQPQSAVRRLARRLNRGPGPAAGERPRAS